jgi:hypothetical protein
MNQEKDSSSYSSSEVNILDNSLILEITENDIETLERMREEEKLARDVYIKMYEK